MARMACTNSRMRAAGDDHGIEKRRSMCCWICEPRPMVKRPFEYWLRSHARLAVVMGLRAKATLMEVERAMRSECSAASTSGKKGSLLISAENAASYPRRSSSAIASGAMSRSAPSIPLTPHQPAPCKTGSGYFCNEPVDHVFGLHGVASAEQIVVVQDVIQVVQHLTRAEARVIWPSVPVGMVKTIIEVPPNNPVIARSASRSP